jgi:hypothetical protein
VSKLLLNLDEETARMAECAARQANQTLEQWLCANIRAAALSMATTVPPVRRIAPLHPGAMRPSADFNAPLNEFAPYV